LTIRYDSAAARSPWLDELRELWRYRDLLRLLISNSIKTRYKRSTLGIVWTLLNPLLSTLVLTIAFSQILRFPVRNYAVYLLVGLLFWNFFAQTTTQAMNTLIWGSSLIKRIYLPRAIFAVSVMGNGVVNFLLALIPLGLIMLVLGHPFRPPLLLLPAAIALLALFTLGMSLLLSAVAIFFVDVVDMYTILLSAWFYLTPIIYPIDIVPQTFARWMRLNPVYILLDVFRTIVYLGEWPALIDWGLAALAAFTTLGLGWWIFTKRADAYAYRI
jgi:ABC-type polysaccharide/polyol phosphate export permease